MANDYLTELATNENVRQPICLCLDVSGSMSGEPIRILNEALGKFYKDLNDEATTKYSADVAIVTFESEAKVYDKFSGITDKKAPSLTTGVYTYMGAGVELSLKILLERKQQYKAHGLDYLQPWLIIMSDGAPQDVELVKKMQAECIKLMKNERLLVISIGIAGANMQLMSEFSTIPAISGSGATDFKKFFRALAKSVVAVANKDDEETTADLVKKELEDWED